MSSDVISTLILIAFCSVDEGSIQEPSEERAHRAQGGGEIRQVRHRRFCPTALVTSHLTLRCPSGDFPTLSRSVPSGRHPARRRAHASPPLRGLSVLQARAQPHRIRAGWARVEGGGADDRVEAGAGDEDGGEEARQVIAVGGVDGYCADEILVDCWLKTRKLIDAAAGDRPATASSCQRRGGCSWAWGAGRRGLLEAIPHYKETPSSSSSGDEAPFSRRGELLLFAFCAASSSDRRQQQNYCRHGECPRTTTSPGRRLRSAPAGASSPPPQRLRHRPSSPLLFFAPGRRRQPPAAAAVRRRPPPPQCCSSGGR